MIKAEDIILGGNAGRAVPIRVMDRTGLAAALKAASPQLKRHVAAHGFEAAPLVMLNVSNAQGDIREIWVGAPAKDADPFSLGAISSKLPSGHYQFASPQPHLVALGFALELYRYDPFKRVAARKVTLACPEGVDREQVCAEINASFMVRDLVNAPANLLGPAELEAVARQVARLHGAKMKVVSGPNLKKNFPLIHVVGAAAERPPRLIDFTWGNPRHPKVTLVGKGVCFDTGGLDIKPSANMLLMKKDMGGAANVLGLADLVMRARLKVRLRVLIPAVENSISDEAFRPGDVYKTRKGLTVEIGNTDAEGRLILCEALALADEEAPDMLVDLATLTGAARVALGPDLPPFYTDDDQFAESLHHHGMAVNDPVWRLPLWRPYMSMIETPIADLNNAGAGGFAGSITAALFLRRFVEKAKIYAHFDIFAWTPASKPGRPKGGEAQAMRALFAAIAERYTK